MRSKLIFCAALLLACDEGRPRPSTPPPMATAVCGDGRVQGDEICDTSGPSGRSCESFGFGAGTLRCKTDCAGPDTSGCGAPPSCGDDRIQTPELCDGTSLANVSCAALGLGPGTVACLPNCAGFSTTSCGPPPTCGNGARDGVEACDGEAFGGLSCARLGLGTGTLTCSADCLHVDTTACHAVPDAGVANDAGITSDGGARDASGPSDATAGEDARVDPCSGVSCSGHGRCAVAGTDVLCVCDLGYEPQGLSCTMHVNGAPVIGNISPSGASVSPTETAHLVAEVSDPDGLGDLGGGRLEDQGGARVALFTAVGAGRYEVDVSWTALNAQTPIEFVGSGSRSLVAVFFDTAGNETRAPVPLGLRCPESGDHPGACAGACTDLGSTQHCGSCTRGCGFTDPVRSWPGMCAPTGNECSFEAALPDGTNAQNCLVGCANLFPGAVCAGASASTYLMGFIGAVPSVSCSQPIDASYPTRVTLSDLNCECRSTSGQYRTLPKPRNTTCTSLCSTTYGDPCFLLHFQGTMTGGASVFGADNCAPPYLRAAYDGVGVGDTIAYQDQGDTLRCDCRVPTR